MKEVKELRSLWRQRIVCSAGEQLNALDSLSGKHKASRTFSLYRPSWVVASFTALSAMLSLILSVAVK